MNDNIHNKKLILEEKGNDKVTKIEEGFQATA